MSRSKAVQRSIDILKVVNTALRANAMRALGAAKLAPGDLNVDPTQFKTDQFLLFKKSRTYGPLFKVWWNGKLTTCVTGIQGGMRFLADHREYLRAATIDMRPIFPFGFLRAMEGPTHARYRRIFQSAFRASAVENVQRELSEIIARGLAAITVLEGPTPREVIAKGLKIIATEVMLRLVLGLGRVDARYDTLVALYETYAPNGMPLSLRSRHRLLYAQMREHVLSHAGDPKNVLPNSLLAALLEAGPLDDTIVGNLIHMVEFARFDMHGLWHWILLEASGHPQYLDDVRMRSEERRALSSSLVSETLRMQQSEFVYRHVTKTFEHDGVLFPKGTRARVCVWEGHRDPEQFSEPDTFAPRRFLEAASSAKGSYAPFGLDHHRCLGANWTIDVSALFLEVVTQQLVLTRVAYGTPYKGHFHFEPGLDSEISIVQRARH